MSEDNVSIVIPVYKDWDSLCTCINSLKKNISTNIEICLINDMSNECKKLEENILHEIKGNSNFKYFRNEQNLGFVQTCNRAVRELVKQENDVLLLNSDTEVTKGFLEEMQEVMQISDRHGIVCPRSNRATLLSIPFRESARQQYTALESYELFLNIREKLPRYSITNTGVGFCILIKRKLIDMFGLFDEVYGKGYNEENDFCMRVNQYGYNVVAANRAFVFHHESLSFGESKAELDMINSKILTARYPYYWELATEYWKIRIDAVDYFAELFDDNKRKPPKLLVYFVGNKKQIRKGGIGIFSKLKLYAARECEIFWASDNKTFYVKCGENEFLVQNISSFDEVFDMIYLPYGVLELKQIVKINQLGLKYCLNKDYEKRSSKNDFNELVRKYADIVDDEKEIINWLLTYKEKMDLTRLRDRWEEIAPLYRLACCD